LRVVPTLTSAQAYAVCEALIRGIYERLVSWLIRRLNTVFQPTFGVRGSAGREDISDARRHASLRFISIIDGPGIYVPAAHASIGDFCAHFLSDKLWNFFVQAVLVDRQQEYQSEGIPWQEISLDNYNPDSLANTEAILCSLIEQYTLRYRSTPFGGDSSLELEFLQELVATASSHFDVTVPSLTTKGKSGPGPIPTFSVRHRGGTVPMAYRVRHMLRTNCGSLPADSTRVLAQSAVPGIATLFALAEMSGETDAEFLVGSTNAASRVLISPKSRRPLTKANKAVPKLAWLDDGKDNDLDEDADPDDEIIDLTDSDDDSNASDEDERLPPRPAGAATTQAPLPSHAAVARTMLHTVRKAAVRTIDWLQMAAGSVYYVLCVSPNGQEADTAAVNSGDITDIMHPIMRQVHELHLLESIHVIGQGFSFRTPLTRFCRRYGALIGREKARLMSPLLAGGRRGTTAGGTSIRPSSTASGADTSIASLQAPARQILSTIRGLREGDYAVGRTRVFLRDKRILHLLERQLVRRLDRLIVAVQARLRGRRMRRRFLRMRAAAVFLQRWWRRSGDRRALLRLRYAFLMWLVLRDLGDGAPKRWPDFFTRQERVWLSSRVREGKSAVVLQRWWHRHLACLLLRTIQRGFMVAPRTGFVTGKEYTVVSWPLAGNIPWMDAAIQGLRVVFRNWSAAQYRKQLTVDMRVQLMQKAYAEDLFRGRKASYLLSVGSLFEACSLDVSAHKNRSNWNELFPSNSLVYAGMITKVNRSDFKRGARILAVTHKNGIYILDTGLRVRGRVPWPALSGVSLSPFDDNLFVLHVDQKELPSDDERKGDYLILSADLIEIVSKLRYAGVHLYGDAVLTDCWSVSLLGSYYYQEATSFPCKLTISDRIIVHLKGGQSRVEFKVGSHLCIRSHSGSHDHVQLEDVQEPVLEVADPHRLFVMCPLAGAERLVKARKMAKSAAESRQQRTGQSDEEFNAHRVWAPSRSIGRQGSTLAMEDRVRAHAITYRNTCNQAYNHPLTWHALDSRTYAQSLTHPSSLIFSRTHSCPHTYAHNH
jgi:hypothetical protein